MATDQLVPGLRRRDGRLAGTPVFLYHGLTAGRSLAAPWRERKYWVSETLFRQHLNQLCSEDYRAVLLREFWDLGAESNGDKPAVVLTFDDGRVSDYQAAYPILLEVGARADFFVNTAAIDSRGYLTWSQMTEMQRSGMSFQSHSHDHFYLTQLPPRILERQLRDSKRLLEDRLGSPVDFLAVPYGELNAQVLEVARQTGYRAVCGGSSWPTRPGDPVVNRVVVYGHTTPRDFHRLLTLSPICYGSRALRAVLLHLPKRLILSLRRPRLCFAATHELT